MLRESTLKSISDLGQIPVPVVDIDVQSHYAKYTPTSQRVFSAGDMRAVNMKAVTPVLVHQLERDGKLSSPISSEPRPLQLRSPQAFAVVAPDTRHDPVIKAGCIFFVDPARNGVVGDDVFVRDKEDKCYYGILTADGVKPHNDKLVKLAVTDIHICHVIVVVLRLRT